jgi:hypothetical protein
MSVEELIRALRQPGWTSQEVSRMAADLLTALMAEREAFKQWDEAVDNDKIYFRGALLGRTADVDHIIGRIGK